MEPVNKQIDRLARLRFAAAYAKRSKFSDSTNVP